MNDAFIIMLLAGEVEAEAKRAGANLFLQKPDGIEQLIEAIGRLTA